MKEYDTREKRIKLAIRIWSTLPLLTAFISVPLEILGFSSASALVWDIGITIFSAVLGVGAVGGGFWLSVTAFRQKRIGAGVFLMLAALSIPVVILLAVTEWGRRLVLYILEGY